MKKGKQFMIRAILGGAFFGLGNFLLDYISPYYSRTWEEYLSISLVFGLGFALLYPRIYRSRNLDMEQRKKRSHPIENINK